MDGLRRPPHAAIIETKTAAMGVVWVKIFLSPPRRVGMGAPREGVCQRFDGARNP
jgi:hypothetical protein